MTLAARRLARDTWWWALALGAAAAAAAAPMVGAVVLVALALGYAWAWPRRMLSICVFATLVVRPSLDIFSQRRAGLSALTVSPSVVFGVLLLAVASLLALRRSQSGRPWWPDRGIRRTHVWLLAVYAVGVSSGVRLYGSVGLVDGTREVVRVLSILAAFLLVCWWAEEEPGRADRGWTYVLLGLAVPIVVALWQLVTGQGFVDESGPARIQGTFAHPNTFGPFLVPFILWSLAALRQARPLQRLGLLVFSGAMASLLVLTLSRTAVLVLAAAAVALPLVQARAIGWRGLARASVLVVAAGAVAWALFGGAIGRRFADVRVDAIAVDAAMAGASENSFTWRLVNWAVLVQLGREHPMLGHGAGMTTELNPVVNSSNGVPFNAHDDWVRFFFETGVVGVLCYLVYAIGLCFWALRCARRAPAGWKAAGGAVAASWLALLLLTLGTPELSLQTAVLYVLYGMLGLVWASGRGSEPDALEGPVESSPMNPSVRTGV